jgi:hypothetical protein
VTDIKEEYNMPENRTNWVTKEQLDIPLCNIFKGTKTNGTARIFVRTSEIILGVKHANLEGMSYEEMNRYIDSLDRQIEDLNNA